MPVSAQASSTTTPTVGTPVTLADVAVAGTFTLHIDKFNLAAGDVLELRVYQMVLTAGTRRVAYYVRFDGVQPTDDLIAISVPISNELTDAGALRFELNQSKGVAKAFPWKVLKYG